MICIINAPQNTLDKYRLNITDFLLYATCFDNEW
jgi:hypothetical protein